MKALRVTILVLLLFTNIMFGQKFTGFVVDQKGDSLAFVNIHTVDRGNQRLTTSDINGHFSFSDSIKQNKKMYAVFGNCFSDTILVTQYKTTNLKLTIIINTACMPITTNPDCRYNYIMIGMYYVNKELKILSGEQIPKGDSPYNYRMIEENKKYLANDGQIFTGKELIAKKELPLELWKNADFKPMD